MKEIKIGNKIVGLNHSTYIIAEIGSNHDGSLNKAKKLINIASQCGVDAVKFQFYKADTIAADIFHEIVILEDGKTLYQLYKENETPYEWIDILNMHCKQNNIEFLATPFDKEAVDVLEEVNIAAFKIASFEIIDYELIKYIASKQKPIILSTGMANLEDIEAAIKVITKYHSKFILLHCGINYPLKYEDVNLKALISLKKAYHCPVGYSDHTIGNIVPIMGVSLGMNMIEKHFTLDKFLEGPDHNFAMDPDELKQLVEEIRIAELVLGSSVKNKVKSEEIHYKRGRRSLFSIKDIKKGSAISHENVMALRPGIGLHPKFLEDIIGKRLIKDIQKYTPISWDLIEKKR